MAKSVKKHVQVVNFFVGYKRSEMNFRALPTAVAVDIVAVGDVAVGDAAVGDAAVDDVAFKDVAQGAVAVTVEELPLLCFRWLEL